MAGETLKDADVDSVQQWLKENPNDRRAPALRAKLRGIGVDAPDPLVSDPLLGRTALQGVLLDPLEKVGQATEHLPDWLGGAAARRAGSAIMSTPYVGDYLRQNQEAAAEHPIARALANVAPWFLMPEAAALKALGVAGDVAAGAGSGVLQPLDPKDPNYWRDLLSQGELGGLTGGVFGKMTRSADTAAQALRTHQAATAAAQRYFDQGGERSTLEMLNRAYRELGEPENAPEVLTPQTAQQSRQYIGGKLNSIYARMSFNPMDPNWQTQATSTYRTMRNTMANPDMQADWDAAFANDALRPVINAERGAPVSGEKLNQIITDLGRRAVDFGEKAEAGGVHAKQFENMAEGLRLLRDAMTQQIDRNFPALGAERRAARRAYSFASTVADATSASEPTAAPKKLIDVWEKKVGKTQYARPRYKSSKDMLQREHAAQQAGPVQFQAPPTKPAGVGSSVARSAAHVTADAIGIETARRLGLPWWFGWVGGSALTEAARKLGLGRVISQAGASAGRRPAGVGAVAGQGAPALLNLVPGGQPETQNGLTP